MESEIKTSTQIQAIYPANSLQQGFIFHAVSQPTDDAYLVQTLFDYHYEINVLCYRQAWELAIKTYPALRLCFNWDETPIQIVTKQGQLHFTLHDLSMENDKNAAILEIQKFDRKQGFDLTKPTLLRLHLIKQSKNSYTLLKTEHHIICDAWSTAVLLNQVHLFYLQLIDGETPAIFQDTAYLQAQTYIQKNQIEAHLYWKKIIHTDYLANDINALFTTHAKPEELNNVKIPCEINIQLDSPYYERLKNLVHDEGITLHGAVQFAWHKILHMYTQTAYTIVGTTISGRTLPIIEIEKSVGLYINTLPLIIRWDNTLTVKEQLHYIHDEIMGLNKYSFVYLSSLQTDGNRLFNSLLLFENLSFTAENLISADHMVTSNRRGIQKLNYPLALTFHVKSNALKINFKYDSTYLNEQHANHLGQQLLHILQQIPCKLYAPHYTIDLLTKEERHQIITTWNTTNVAYPHEQTLHAMFEMQVLRSPDAIALVFNEQHLTYSELNAQANQLARLLHENGLHSSELIPLCLDRSPELLIAILAVLKAGCAYVPIDPSYPLSRINYILTETKGRFLLTQSQHETNLRLIIDANINCILLDKKLYKAFSPTQFSISCTSTDLAYVIYTSGTTGTPKGVAITHAGAVNRLDWMQRTYPLNTSDAVLQKTPYGFDVSVWELLWAHWIGARIVMARPDGHKDPQYLQKLIAKEKITVVHFVPSMLTAFTESLTLFKLTMPNSLRFIFCSGEALFANQVNALYQISGDAVSVHNLYGPTEASIDVTSFSCHRGAENIYIGRPIQNTRVYVLNTHLQPVPVGVIGELYLGGAGLAREYWHQPELTAAAFIHNLFANEDDHARGYTRLYKTGDLVRWLPDGNLEYVGRADSQIKIRGFRIELSEIEQVMLSIEGISQAVAILKENISSDYTHRFIAAYYVGTMTEKNVQAHLEKQLPDYMVPTSLIALSSFPLTSNGKLDRNALPPPFFMKETINEIILPRNAFEKTLCNIWANILKVPNVKITDNFFNLGGDSILSIRLVAAMQKNGCHVSVTDVFKHKTLLQLLKLENHTHPLTQKTYSPFLLVDEATQKNIFSGNEKEAIEDIYPASYLQMGMLVESLKTNSQGTYHDVFAYTINHIFNETLLLTLFKDLSEKHPLLRTAFIEHDEYGYVCVQHTTLNIVSHYGGVVQKNVAAFIQAEKNRSLSINKPGLFCLFVLNPTPEQFVLVFSFHHAITDGWSVASLISEFTSAYINEKKIVKEVIPLYQRVIQQERLALTSPKFEAFWRDYLADAPLPAPNLVFNSKALPKVLINKHLQTAHLFDIEKSNSILSTAKRLGVSPDILLLAAYFKTLSRFFNNDDVVLGLVMNNRLEEENADKVFGLHLNTLPIRVFVGNNSKQLVIDVAEQRISLDAYKAYPYGKIRSSITKTSDIYTCAFNYIHFHIVDSEANSFDAIQIFEKTTIPLTLHVSRQQNNFQLVIKALNGFIDHETANHILAYIQHDLNVIIDGREFNWLSADHPQLFSNWHTQITSDDQPAIESQKPRNALEKALCHAWKSVLDISHVGITDNFFELGGDSIRSIRLVAKMQDIGFYVTVGDIFKHKTILQLLEQTNHTEIKQQEAYFPFSLINDATKINIFARNEENTIEDIYPAGYLQMGMLVESLKIEAKGAYHDVFAYTIHHPFNKALLLGLFKSLSIKHPLLRTAFVEHDEHGYICLQYSDLDIASHYGGIIQKNIPAFIHAEKNRPFSISQPGLFRLFALNPTANQFILVFSFHHAITDGWSVASLISELTEAYINEKEINAATIPLYQRVIQQERLTLTSHEIEAFWRDYLADAPLPAQNLLFHSTASTEALEISHSFENEKSSQVLLISKRLGVSPDTLFLAAYFRTLSRFFNQADVVIGLVMNNRLEEAGGDRVFGLHLNTLPMRVLVGDNSQQLSIELSQQRAKLEAYKAYPYGKIRSDITQGNDIYTCAFNYIYFHVMNAEENLFNTSHVFEKTTIPLTLHISRQKDNFNMTLKTLNGFIDHKTADHVLAYLKHDINAIINGLEFTWLSTDDPQHFCIANTHPIVDSKKKLKNNQLAPRNALEKALCQTWQDVLDISSVCITDNFFELGGDSIRSIRLVAKMQENGFYVSVSDIFKHKTLLQLIEKTNHTYPEKQETYLPFSFIDDVTRMNIFNNNEEGIVEDIYPAGHLQMSMLLASLKINAHGTYHDVFAYTIHRQFDEARLLTIFKKLSVKHPVLRTAFVPDDKYGFICVQYSELDMVSHYGGIITEEVPTFIQSEKNHVFLISNPGLFHLFILNPLPDQFVLVFSFHHAITDGWSVASLMSEFAKAYAGINEIVMETIPLYQNVIQQEQLALASNTYEMFWREYLKNAPLPKNHLVFNATAQTSEQLEIGCVLGDLAAAYVLENAKRLGISPDIIFLAAYFKTLSQFLNQSDLILGLVMNNRLAEIGGDKVFGLHLNILPFRMNINIHNKNDAFILSLANERLRLEAHKVYPYKKLCLDLNNPGGFYNCAFNYTHFYINEHHTNKKLIQPLYAFEKMSIPLTLQVSRYQNSFRLIIRTSYQFIDKETVHALLERIQFLCY